MKFILSALVALFCFSTFAIDGTDVGCTIIIDVLRYDSEGGVFASPTYGEDAEDTDSLQLMAGYDFITRRFPDVEDAAFYWREASGNLWSAYAENNTVMTSRRRQAANLGAVAYAFAYNNATIQQKYMTKIAIYAYKLKEASRSEIDQLTSALQEVKDSKTSCSEKLSKLEGSINGKIGEMQAAVNETSASVKATQTKLASIQQRLSQATTPEQIKNIQMEFNKKLAEAEQKALEAGLSKKAYDQVLKLLQVTKIAGGELPAEVASYSNQMARLNVYLGLDKDENGEPLENKGMFEEPNMNGGGKAGNINEYLNSFGVVSVNDSDEGDESDSNPFSNRFDIKSGKVSATFKAPNNWVDNDTIVVNAAGRYEAKPKPDLSRPWAFDPETRTFKNASVLCGSVNIVVENASASSAGNYYCHVIADTEGGYTASVSRNGIPPDNGWCFLVASLEYSSKENEDGIVEQILVPAFSIGAVPIIVAYD